MRQEQEIQLINEFARNNPMPERTYCKQGFKIENITLNFEYEYTKSQEVIDELNDNDVDTDQYITEESKKKYALAEIEQAKQFFEHGAKCDNAYCKWAYARDSFVKANLEKSK